MSHRSSILYFGINGGFSFGVVHMSREHKGKSKIKERQREASRKACYFFDLDIAIKYNIFTYKLFDKRCKFPFSYFRFPNFYLSLNFALPTLISPIFFQTTRTNNDIDDIKIIARDCTFKCKGFIYIFKCMPSRHLPAQS